LELDHVLIAVGDLAAAAREFEVEHGLASIEGGRHPGWGTANRIVPLGKSYLELVAVVDEDEAARCDFGRWVAAVEAGPSSRPFGWAVRTNDLDEVAHRLGRPIGGGSRVTPEGRMLRWRAAVPEQPAAEPSLPFFIEWAEGSPFPGCAAVTHPAGAVEIARLELRGHVDRLSEWLGRHELPISVRQGRPSVERVVLKGPGTEIVLGGHRTPAD
jgi:Glyoxalase-like domain